MSEHEKSKAEPKGRIRAKPGSKKETGDYYHVEVRDKNQFTSFRTQDIGRKGHTQRVAGRRDTGSWDTQKWLISKEDAHVKKGIILADDEGVKQVLDNLGSKPKHLKGDIFKAKPRPNIPEKIKPTKAQKKARRENIKKAQESTVDRREYEQRTKKELDALAKKRGLSGFSTLNKKDLIQKLRKQ